jgi:hypothetical protein
MNFELQLGPPHSPFFIAICARRWYKETNHCFCFLERTAVRRQMNYSDRQSCRTNWLLLRIAAIATCGMVVLFAGAAHSATISWTNTSGGFWGTPNNWDAHVVPGGSDTAVITANGTYTVTVDTAVAVAALTLGGAGQQILTNNTQTMTIAGSTVINANGILEIGGATLSGGPMTLQGTFDWSGGTLELPVTIAASGTLNMNGTGVNLYGAVTNNGAIHLSGSGPVVLYNNQGAHGSDAGAIYNEAGGLFDLQTDQGVANAVLGSEVFVNAGTLRKSSGTGTSSIGVACTNSGTVDAESGTIRFAFGGNIGGAYNAAAGATIEFDAGSFTQTGAVTVTGAGVCRQNGATVTLLDRITRFILFYGNVALAPNFQTNGTIKSLQLDGATLIGTNTVTGTLGIDGGALGQSSALTINVGGTLEFNGAPVNIYSPLTNGGSVIWTGSSIAVGNNGTSDTGVIYNQPGGLFLIQCDQGLGADVYGAPEVFLNAGTVRKIAGLGTTTFGVGFTNSGVVDAQSGTIQFQGGGNIGGNYNTASGALIQFTGGSFVQSGTPTVTGSGLCRLNGATATLNDRIANFSLVYGNVALTPTFQTNGAIHNLQLDGATLIGTNTVTGTLGIDGGALGQSSALTVNVGGTLDFNGAAVNIYCPLTNGGSIIWTSGNIAVGNNGSSDTGVIYNQPGGLFLIECDQNLGADVYGAPEVFLNTGTVRKTAGLGTTAFGVGFTNSGVVDAQSGTIQFQGGGNIGGNYNTASGALIQFNVGSYVQTGTPTVTGSGLCRLNGATVTLNDRIANFLLNFGNVALTPTFQTNGAIHNLQLDGATLTGNNLVTGTLTMNGGAIGQGPLTVSSGGVLDLIGTAMSVLSPLTNAGTINWISGNIGVGNNGTSDTGSIYNQAGGLFLIQCDQGLGADVYGAPEIFLNAGTVRKTAGLGTTAFSLGFTNSGVVDAQSGAIQFSGGGNIGGNYNTASAALIQFTTGSFVQAGTPTVTGSGLCRQNGATVTLSDRIANFPLVYGNVVLTPTFQTNGAIHNLQLDGATLTGTNVVVGTLTMNGSVMAQASPLTIAGGGVMNLSGSFSVVSPLTNAGTINWTGGGIGVGNNGSTYTGVIYNQPGGLFLIQSDQGLGPDGYGAPEIFFNAGTVRKIAGLATTTFSTPFTNSGTLDVQSGIIHFGGAYTQVGGTMNFGITSLADYGQITFVAGAPFTGTVSANLNAEYSPSIGDSFSLVTYASHAGIFTSASLPPQAGWQTNYSATAFTLTVLSVTNLPPPVTLTPVSHAGGNFTLQINGPVGPAYVIQASSNLLTWIPLVTNTPSTVPFNFTDTNAGGFTRRFYRVQLQ